MRTVAALAALLVVALVLGAGAPTVSGQREAVEELTGFGVTRTTYRTGMLYVFVPHEPKQPAMTGDSPYFTMHCSDAEGRRVLSMRAPWAIEDDDDHFHAPLSRATALRLDRCRLDGIQRLFTAAVTDGPADGAHADSLPQDPRISLDPLGF